MYRLEDYAYDLPEALIAQSPSPERDQSRLMHLSRASGAVAHRRFGDIVDLLAAGDALVLNNTRVVPGRLLGRKQTGGRVEALILDYAVGAPKKVFTCLVKAAKRPKPGSRLMFDLGLEARVLSVDAQTCSLAFSGPADFEQVLDAIGHMPLPPYIRREDSGNDRHAYQTVYAAHKGAIAAPTAGLHFTRELLQRLARKGVQLVYLTLHVGYGTFSPVHCDDIRHHRMHSEWFTLPAESAETVNAAKRRGNRVAAVGTTCVRTLEYCADPSGLVSAQSGSCDLFIYPGYDFKVVDAMITNFHLPRSTLLMLVSAYVGRETILNAYSEAIRANYRFYSYGDGMVII
jgi:S-adenosylmethionine:tRNA ribosyltransferase-isomerase